MSTSSATLTNPHQTFPPQKEPGPIKPLLVFYLGERAYGLSIEGVVQVIPMLKLALVPQVEPVIEGVANIHGKIVPILSARRTLGLPVIPHRLYTPIILTEIHGRMTGLIVDDVDGVIHLDAGQLIAPASILPEGVETGGLLEGVVYHADRAIIVLNPQVLLRPLQLRALTEAIRSIPAGRPAADGPAQAGQPAHPEIPQPSVTPAQAAAASPKPAAPEGNGRKKSQPRARQIEATLAGEIAHLAADLAPCEGQCPPQPPASQPSSDEIFPSSSTPASE